ncbi:uncharacterized protein A4U43_C08F4470 [Asparagus officinalis]|nr:uncharacterized protein A4U43_C08F4470 [Asparagus officinalis]
MSSGGNGCGATGCLVDLNGICPGDLRVLGGDGGTVVACKSACEAFGSPELCCSGSFGSPTTCTPSSYSQLFKNACPRAYSYAYDDLTSTFTCAGASGYAVTFCPSTMSVKSSGENHQHGSKAPLINVNETMVFLGGQDFISHAAHASPMFIRLLPLTILSLSSYFMGLI